MLETLKNRFLLQDSYLVMFLIAVDDLNYNNLKIFILALKGINEIFCQGATRLLTGSWIVRSTPERPAWVQDLAGEIVLWSWVRHFTLTVPLSTQVYNWVPASNPSMK